MKTKNLVLALLILPALAACKSAYMGADDASEEASVEVTDTDDANRNRNQENERNTNQNQSGS